MNEYEEYVKKLARESVREAIARLGEREEDNELPPDWTSIEVSKPMVTDGWSEPIQILLQSGLIKDNFAYNGYRFLPLMGKNVSTKSTIVAWRYKEDVPPKINTVIRNLRRANREIPKIDNPFDGTGTDFYYETSEAMRYERYYIDKTGGDIKIMVEMANGRHEQIYKDRRFPDVPTARRFLVREAARNGWWLVNGRVY